MAAGKKVPEQPGKPSQIDLGETLTDSESPRPKLVEKGNALHSLPGNRAFRTSSYKPEGQKYFNAEPFWVSRGFLFSPEKV